MRVVLAGGGTAGHVNPLLAVATELHSRGHHVTVAGTAQGLESDLVPAAGFKLNVIEKVPFPRRPNLDALRFPSRFVASIRQASTILKDCDAQLVVGFGGYVSTPFYLAAKRLGVPIAIHEQNARPGLANRLGARWASLVGLTFPNTPLSAGRGRTQTVGLPLRSAIADLVAVKRSGDLESYRANAAKELGLDPSLRTLLVTGGSLGAQHLNETMVEAMAALPADLQVIHLTGRNKAGPVQDAVSALGRKHYLVQEYAMNMEQFLGCSDLVICRSGAGTVAEMTALGLPAVYVPLPIGNGEQRLNAEEVTAAEGAKLVADKKFDASYIADVVLPWIYDSDALARAASSAAACGRPQATGSFVDLLVGVGKSEGHE